MSDAPENQPKQGPPNPQAEGVEAATPPGGPLRQDEAPGTSGGPEHDDDASASPTNDKHASETGGHTIAPEDEQPGPSTEEQAREQAEQEGARGGDTLQFENAETSLDQPSEG